jgi:outer membrane protein insertion porin family
VRGYAQNQLGPAIYLVPHYDTIPGPADTVFFRDTSDTRYDRVIPTGGNTLLVGNVELQLPSPVLASVLRFALFTDAGDVWNRGTSSEAFHGVRVTPGAGVRIRSIFGVIRVDLGYRPYALRTGSAYYIASTLRGQALYCVSPDNTLPVTFTPGELPDQHGIECPSSFEPITPHGFFRRLNPSIWIGNAF